jgi:hypothetical protein
MHKGGILSFVPFASFGVLVGLSSLVACSSGGGGGGGGGSSGGSGGGSCSTVVEDTNLQQCAGCSPSGSCTTAQPLDACCNWVAEPKDPLLEGTGLHRYSAPAGTPATTPGNTTCLGAATPLGTKQTVTLTGYVWLFSSGQDSAGVQVDVYTENNPNSDGSISASPIGTYTTTSSDPIDPTDTSWNTKCNNGCSYRQYTIQNVPTETPLVIKTSDAGSMQWATLYDYNIYFSNSEVQSGKVSYDAEAVAGPDLTTVAQTVGQTIQPNMGLLAGEVHDCTDVRVAGATVASSASNNPTTYYFTADESNPLPSLEQTDTSILGLYGFINVPTGSPVRVSAVAQDPGNAGQYLMIGTYTVQVYPGAVTALVLRGRRPWQP